MRSLNHKSCRVDFPPSYLCTTATPSFFLVKPIISTINNQQFLSNILLSIYKSLYYLAQPAVMLSVYKELLLRLLVIANLSRLEIIKIKPIGERLNGFYNLFKSIYKDLGISSSLNALNQIGDKGNVYLPIIRNIVLQKISFI